jgi:hypothetical protein
MKLASGMTAPHRLQDLADVLRLIRAADLPRDFAAQIDPYVRGKFEELWLASRHPKTIIDCDADVVAFGERKEAGVHQRYRDQPRIPRTAGDRQPLDQPRVRLIQTTLQNRRESDVDQGDAPVERDTSP